MVNNPHLLLFSSIKPSLNSNQFEMVNDQTSKLAKAIEIKNNNLESLRTKIDTMLKPLGTKSPNKKIKKSKTQKPDTIEAALNKDY